MYINPIFTRLDRTKVCLDESLIKSITNDDQGIFFWILMSVERLELSTSAL